MHALLIASFLQCECDADEVNKCGKGKKGEMREQDMAHLQAHAHPLAPTQKGSQ